jgi:HEAT repeat protein
VPRKPPVEEQLARLRDVRADPLSHKAAAILRETLGSADSPAVARAAEIIRDFEIAELAGELETAFRRFLANPQKNDKGCGAKTAIAHALCALGADAPDTYLTGVRHIQMEGSYGPPVDTAAELRGACALGLVNTRHTAALVEAVTLLADKEATTRAAAARALAVSGRPEASLALRLKVLTGDTELEVVEECMTALLVLAPRDSLPLIAAKIADSESAARALGRSRLPGAFDVLRQAWEESADSRLRTRLLHAIGLLGLDNSIEFLVGLIGNESEKTAADAIQALGNARHDSRTREAVEREVRARQSAKLLDLFHQTFPE